MGLSMSGKLSIKEADEPDKNFSFVGLSEKVRKCRTFFTRHIFLIF